MDSYKFDGMLNFILFVWYDRQYFIMCFTDKGSLHEVQIDLYCSLRSLFFILYRKNSIV